MAGIRSLADLFLLGKCLQHVVEVQHLSHVTASNVHIIILHTCLQSYSIFNSFRREVNDTANFAAL